MPHMVMVFWTPSTNEEDIPGDLGSKAYICSWSNANGLRTVYNRKAAPCFSVLSQTDMIRANNFQQILSSCLPNPCLVQFEVFDTEE